MKIINLAVEDLKPYENNAKIHTEKQIKQIKKSIKKFGMNDPIGVWSEDNLIVEGHGRLEACKELGIKEVPCIRLDHLSDKERKAYTLAHNKLTMNTDFDIDVLNIELDEINVDIDMSEFGFELPEEEQEIIEDEVPKVDEENEPIAKLGDIWQLGKHRLLCGNSTDPEQVARLMNGVKADMLLTDPPYNVNYEGKTKDALKIENDKMDNDSFRQFLKDAFFSADSVMKAGAVFYIWHADSEGYNFRGACFDIYWKVRQCLIWNKNTMVMGRQDYHWKHEPCQPKGTKVLTPEGYKNIEDLKDDDTVVSFNSYDSTVKGYKSGYKIKIAKRHFSGDLIHIHANNKVTSMTPNHKVTIKFNETKTKIYCVYLMQKGDRFRIGITETYNSRGFGLKQRMRQEKSDAAWILTTAKDKQTALIYEQYISITAGIPTTHWEVERGFKNPTSQRTEKHIDLLYSFLDVKDQKEKAIKILKKFKREYDYPFILKEEQPHKLSTRVTTTIKACNVIPEIMKIPVAFESYQDNKTCVWTEISHINYSYYNDLVYSLEVDTYEHYVADGLVVHNCLYGWKDGAGHLWASDRKQTTVIDFQKPNRNADHPTMKPVGLFDYQIKNNTKAEDIVLDLFMGSGTTIMACEQNGRIAYGCELDSKYVDVIIKRYENLTGNKAVLIENICGESDV